MGGELTWREATDRALYGPDGFFRRPEGPLGHFRTSSAVAREFARPFALLADAAGLDTVVDVGAGRGEFLGALHEVAPHLHLVGIEVVPRPPAVASSIDWSESLPARIDALVVANEWLDNIPLDVAVLTDDGPRLVLVDPLTGTERLGPTPPPGDAGWLEAWWPLDDGAPGDRAEIGRPRDDAWADVVRRVGRGVVVAIDYAHTRAERAAGLVARGTIAGYRDGRAVPPVPDGSCDITAFVALDACQAAGEAAGASRGALVRQRAALQALGVAPAVPPRELARQDPRRYLDELASAYSTSELLAHGGLGDFSWLLQPVGCPLPSLVAALS